MRGKPKDVHHCHCNNKHYKQKLVRVLLDSGSDSDLVCVNKGQTHAASLLKKAGSTVMEYFEWDLPDKVQSMDGAEFLWILW